MARDELHQRLDAFLRSTGTPHRWLPKRGKHRAIEITRGDDVRRFYVPNTPSDWRAVRNAVAMVKRALRASP